MNFGAANTHDGAQPRNKNNSTKQPRDNNDATLCSEVLRPPQQQKHKEDANLYSLAQSRGSHEEPEPKVMDHLDEGQNNTDDNIPNPPASKRTKVEHECPDTAEMDDATPEGFLGSRGRPSQPSCPTPDPTPSGDVFSQRAAPDV